MSHGGAPLGQPRDVAPPPVPGGRDKRGDRRLRAGVCVDVIVQGSVCTLLLPICECDAMCACVF